MQKNMGTTDKTIRIAAAIVLALLAITGVISGTLAIIAYIVAAVFVFTSLVSFCPAYLPFGIRTCRKG